MFVKVFLFCFLLSNFNQLISSSVVKSKGSIENNVLNKGKTFFSVKSVSLSQTNSVAGEVKSFYETEELVLDNSITTVSRGENPPKQLVCQDKDEKLCSNYEASIINCTNVNYQQEPNPSFVCAIHTARITNKNVDLFEGQIICAKPEETSSQYYFEGSCSFHYSLGKKPGYDQKDDEVHQIEKSTSVVLIALIVIVFLVVLSTIAICVYRKKTRVVN